MQSRKKPYWVILNKLEVIKMTANEKNIIQAGNACVIIPTYNEAGNIVRLLDSVYDYEKELNTDNWDLHVLIVDDNSPDKTADVIKSYMKKEPRVHLLFRKQKNGLGAAYIAGMKYAMSKLEPDVVFEMDADHSHDPKEIFPMLSEISVGYDFVIGSRYIKGGSIPENWGIKRKIISKVANIFSKLVLNIRDVQDCTGGYRAIRTAALKNINLSSLSVKGYAFQIALLNAMIKNHFKIKEIPIAFHDRTEGKSKMGLNDMTELGAIVLRLALQNNQNTERKYSRDGSMKATTKAASD
jgi:dolichol-phosphate mannosyltransferase